MMTTQQAIDAAAAGQNSPVLLYWDAQDPANPGPAFRYHDGSDSGPVEPSRGVERLFGDDGRYVGPAAGEATPRFTAG